MAKITIPQSALLAIDKYFNNACQLTGTLDDMLNDVFPFLQKANPLIEPFLNDTDKIERISKYLNITPLIAEAMYFNRNKTDTDIA
jgi:ABC-type transporter Mla subunit MlaD